MDITEKMSGRSCPEGIPYFLEQSFLNEAAELCGLNPKAKDAFFSEAAEIRASREKTEHLWHCHWVINNLNKGPEDKVEGNFFLSYAILAALPKTKAFYLTRNIPLKVLKDTALDLEIWAQDCYEKTGKWGCLHPYWLKNTFDCALFRLGRLQFEARPWHEENKLMRKADGKLEFFPLDAEEFSPVLFKYQDMYLNVHIPACAPLNYEECKASLEEAKIFYPKYLPEIQSRCFRCCSWLLDRQLKHCLPESSNILLFQSLFEDVPKLDGDSDYQHRERIFGNPDIPLDKAPRKTSLQRKFIECLEKGIKFGYGQGIIL